MLSSLSNNLCVIYIFTLTTGVAREGGERAPREGPPAPTEAVRQGRPGKGCPHRQDGEGAARSHAGGSTDREHARRGDTAARAEPAGRRKDERAERRRSGAAGRPRQQQTTTAAAAIENVRHLVRSDDFIVTSFKTDKNTKSMPHYAKI